jgi:glycosyltransferase involved in cell wall biosynthesis
LLVNSAWPQSWGGGEKWTVEAAKWFVEQRHAAAVVGRQHSMLLQGAARRGLEHFEFSFGGDFDPFAAGKAKRLLKSYRPDCVLVNFNKEAWQFGLAARSLKIPVLARHGFPLLRNKFHHRLLLRKLITKLVVNAPVLKEDYLKEGLAAEKAEVIFNGVRDVPPAKGELRKLFEIPREAKLILAAGRLESQKRFDRVIEIAKVLCPEYPELRFLILGNGHLKSELEAQIERQGLSDSVRLGKFVRNFASLAADADLFLLTSQQEGTPNVLLEAMAAGVCSLATPVGSVPEIFGDRFSDLLLHSEETAAMSEVVRSLVNDDTRRHEMAQAQRAHVLAEFGFDKSMRLYEELIARLILHRS